MKPTSKFYIKLYLFWAFFVSATSLVYATILSLFSALLAYISKGLPAFNRESLLALKEIVIFSFPISFSLSFILILLLVFKKIFSRKIDNFYLRLYDCNDEMIEKPLLSDITMLWRKWLFVTVWSLLIFMVLFLGVWKLLSGEFPPAHWFNAVSLYLLIMLLGGAVFVLGIKNCKKIRISGE